MNFLNKAVFFAVGLFLCSLFFTVEINAQCVGCTPAPPGFICTAATSGGDSCATGDGGTCTLTGACIAHNDRGSGDNTLCSPKILGHVQVKISDKIIMNVASYDPRMAIALINVGKIAVEFNQARISFSPIEYTFDDVENHLSQSYNSSYFTALKLKAGEALKAGGTPVLYEVSITEDVSSNSVILTVRSSDPSALRSSIELNLSKITFGKGKNESGGFKAINWQFK